MQRKVTGFSVEALLHHISVPEDNQIIFCYHLDHVKFDKQEIGPAI